MRRQLFARAVQFRHRPRAAHRVNSIRPAQIAHVGGRAAAGGNHDDGIARHRLTPAPRSERPRPPPPPPPAPPPEPPPPPHAAAPPPARRPARRQSLPPSSDLKSQLSNPSERAPPSPRSLRLIPPPRSSAR